jgi:hypothetical protein
MLFDDSFEHEVWYWSEEQINNPTSSTTASTSTPLASTSHSTIDENKSTIDTSSSSTPSVLPPSSPPPPASRPRVIDPSLERVVLLFDFWNPLLTSVERDVLHQILPKVPSIATVDDK